MNTTPIPNSDYLKECFYIDGGALVWRQRPESHFPVKGKRDAKAIANMWNAKNAGRIAGRIMSGKMPYRQVGINGVRFLEHRIVAAMHGIPTDAVIDHIDGNALNNNPENLRAASQYQNCMNRIGWRTRAGHPGVYKRQRKDGSICYRAIYNKKQIGTFESIDGAIAARNLVEKRHRGEFFPKRRSAFAAERGIELNEVPA